MTVRSKGIIALLLPLAALLFNTALMVPIYFAGQSAQAWVEHTFAVRTKLDHVPAGLANVTVGLRIYRLTKESSALKAADLAEAILYRDMDEVQSLTADNLSQQRRMVELRRTIRQRIDSLKELSLGPQPPPVDREIQSQLLRQSLLGIITRMDREEQGLLVRRQKTQEQTRRIQIWAEAISLLVGILSGTLGIWLFLVTEASIRGMNQVLEERVTERTRQLAEANEELEAFCSSVSHDLRAPLRSVEGFAKILMRDYNQLLDERGQDSIRRIRAATVRMGHLIEDLLKLSRISRTEVVRQTADLSALAAAVCDELRASQPERQVKIDVEPGLKAQVDPRLVRVVFENLLGNAWKFTRKEEQPQIIFGIEAKRGEEPSYYIRDNGAGFDMASAEQLFVPFQRLHSASEFEGSGIGLATVQRVISRHRGKIWANSTPGQGATFFFTLGDRTHQGTRD